MGILSDYLEQSRERIGQFVDNLPLMNVIRACPIEQIQIISCPLCEKRFTDDVVLREHIIAAHANQHVYVKANGSIIYGATYIEKSLNDLQIGLISDVPINVTILIDDHKKFEFFIDKNKSPFSCPIDTLIGNILIKIRSSRIEKDLLLYCGKIPELNNKEIDEDAFDLLFQRLHKGQRPDLEKFKQLHMALGSDYLERRYSTAFFSYALAFDLVGQGKQGKDHFESALNDLRIFATPFAISAQRVLAFRMNFFGLLQNCCSPSRFVLANSFFNEKENRYNLKSRSELHELRGVGSEYGVFIDEFASHFLDALSAYYSNNWEIFDIFEHKLDRLIQAENTAAPDRNNMDKIALLKARTAIKKNNISQAKDWYYQIYTHPIFSSEAKEICQ